MLSQLAYDAEQFVLRLAAPKCAAHAAPGSFAHLTCDADHPDAPAAVDHARGPAGRLDRDPLQGRGPGPARARRPQGRRHGERARARSASGSRRTPSARARCCSAAASASRRWCSSPSACKERRAASGRWCSWARRCHFRFARAPRTHHRRRHARRRDRLHAAARGVGRAEPPGEQVRLPRLLRRLRHRPGAPSGSHRWMPAQLAQVEIFACGPTPMLRASRGTGAPLRGALPGVARGVHGLRGRRLRRLHGARCARRAGPAMKRVCVDGPVFDAYSVF